MTDRFGERIPKPRHGSETWQPSPSVTLKINCDGAFSAKDFSRATGVVIRRADGSFHAPASRWLPTVASALIADAEAYRDGLRLMHGAGSARVLVETDSLQLVTLWKNRKNQRSQIDYTRCSANIAAHMCAKLASLDRPSYVWHDQPLIFLMYCLKSECTTAV
ncbi:hypothetical protein SETIT_3G245300v2 [Setaria italica]|uniref:RNase H type-1 domain-containing protein n=1 Tax=Setaria italica TaxID=4555 RepID=K3ZCM0_SETIT|nr:hypothetical protein SETIT_3G245300v2 [Setaria italica]